MADVILCVHGSRDPKASPFSEWQHWSYDNHARVRWQHATYDFDPQSMEAPKLIVFDWSGTNWAVSDAGSRIHSVWPETPVIVRSDGMQPGVPRERFLEGNARLRLQIRDPEHRSFADFLAQLNVCLLPVEMKVSPSPDLALDALLHRLGGSKEQGLQRLNWIVEKFLPEHLSDVVAYVASEGWSGDPVLRLDVKGAQHREFFLKLSYARDRRAFVSSVENHLAAQHWLGTSTVQLHPPAGGFLPGAESLVEVFPVQRDASRDAYQPVCWVSGAKGSERSPLKRHFRAGNELFLGKAYTHLLTILSRGSGGWREWRQPIEDPGKKDFFTADTARRARVLGQLADMERYARATPGWDDWRNDFDRVRTLLEGKIPGWLFDAQWVVRGETHWDPHSRNVLVSASDPTDMLLIDCGDYRADGFPITDLAQIEADLKLILMTSDEGGFADLRPGALKHWKSLEDEALARGLQFKSSDVANRAGMRRWFPPSPVLAYRLIAVIRERALQLSQGDSEGRHYFASLLFWSLRWLTLPAMRPTKKLLAIYSAAGILKGFGS